MSKLKFIIVSLLIALLYFSSPVIVKSSAQKTFIIAIISETLVSVDDPNFKPYNQSSGNGVIARIVDVNGVKYFQSLIDAKHTPPPDDYSFRYLTGLPEVNTTEHWKLYFKHYIVNLGDVDLENCALDGWHTYLIASGGSLYGNLWRLHKYNSSSPTFLKAKTTAIANTSYIIHNIPSNYRVTFLFSLKSGDAIIDSWVEQGMIGREIIKFKGPNYTLPLMELYRIKPGTVKLTPPKLIEYNFKITNLNEANDLRIRLEYKFGETTVWEMQLWPSGNQGNLGSTEFTLKPLEAKSINMSLLFPEDKDDHAVLVYFGVLILKGEEAPPLIGEIWETLYGINSYLGVKESWVKQIINSKENSSIEVFTIVAPYASPFSQDILPYEHYLELRVFDAHYSKLVYGPVKIIINGIIKKGDEMLVNYTIPLKELGYRDGRYIVQIDTYRKGLFNDMNLARISLPFHLSLPNLRLENLRLADNPRIGVENAVVVTLSNIGEASANDFKVGFYVNNKLLEEKRVSLKPGESTDLTFSWIPQKNKNEISVKADVDGILPEGRLEDNEVSKTIIVGWGIKFYLLIIPAVIIVIVTIVLLYKKKFEKRKD